MTHNTFYVSDLHLGHEKTWSTFKKADGSPLRPFTSTEEMDETIIRNWNQVVRPVDRVYVLGDCVIARKNLHLLGRLQGRKILIRGNHDIWSVKDYLPYFEDVHGVYVDTKRGFVCSHVPLHPESLGRWNRNVHGHLHANRVMMLRTEQYLDEELQGFGTMVEQWVEVVRTHTVKVIDPRYLNVSCEQVDYTPISYEEVTRRFEEQGG